MNTPESNDSNTPSQRITAYIAGFADWRAIDLHEGDAIDEPAIQDLVRAAVALNSAGGKKK